MKELSQERMMTVKEVAEVLGVAESTVRNKNSKYSYTRKQDIHCD